MINYDFWTCVDVNVCTVHKYEIVGVQLKERYTNAGQNAYKLAKKKGTPMLALTVGDYLLEPYKSHTLYYDKYA